MKVSLIITSYNEPRTIGRAIEAALAQETEYSFNIVISAPDEPTLSVARRYSRLYPKKIAIFKDPGKGKSFALNILFKKIKADLLLLTDGDVYLAKTAVQNLISMFEDSSVGCVTGRPVPIEDRKEKYGYWANFLFEAAHQLRREAFRKKEFIECSGYFFGFRQKEIESIPLDVAEDTYIPYVFAHKGYQIAYAEKSRVMVKNVNNWKDWIKQKARTSKAHETLSQYVDTKKIKRVKSFSKESFRGIRFIFTYPRNLKEFYWTLQLVCARCYMWLLVLYDTRLKNRHYKDGWQRSESSK